MSATTCSFSIGDSTIQMPVKAGTIGHEFSRTQEDGEDRLHIAPEADLPAS
jgi:hypothetical protein